NGCKQHIFNSFTRKNYNKIYLAGGSPVYEKSVFRHSLLMIKLRIGILGTRGITNHYGGFECFAEYVSRGLVNKGHEVYVYNSHNHPNQQATWNGVHIIHCFDPEFIMHSFGQFIYDLNCINDARKRKFDIILFLGYTSSTIWGMFYPRKPIIIYNMDGFEWKRSKYS